MTLCEGVDWRCGLAALTTLFLLWVGAKIILSSLLTTSSVRPDAKRHSPGFKVVITGSTRGLGLALARRFLPLGDDVVINGRSPKAVEECARRLRDEFPGRQVVGVAADVSKPDGVEALAGRAAEELGQIDIWVCNAGLSAARKVPVASAPAEELVAIVEANLTGALLGARAAISRMTGQSGGGKFFMMDGNGSRGSPTPGNAAYGATKRSLVQLKGSLAAEVKGTRVGVHLLSPGMVATDLLTRHADNPRSARIINTLAEEPDTVAAWLVPRIRGVKGNGAYIRYLTLLGVLWRFATAGRRRGRFVPESRAAIAAAGYEQLPRTE